MPTSARTSLGFFGQFADVGIRAPEQNGLLQQALTKRKRYSTPAVVPVVKITANSVTLPGSNWFADAIRGWRPAALRPATIWQPFRLRGTDDFVVTLTTDTGRYLRMRLVQANPPACRWCRRLSTFNQIDLDEFVNCHIVL